MAPRFSVLLPTHNRADVLGYAIQSVLWQTEQDFELLIVGDGCTDGTAEVVAGFNDQRIRWFDLPKAPYFGYANRNIVLKQAKGDLIAYMAHDNIMLGDHLSLLAATLERTGAEWTYGRSLWVSCNGMVAVFPMNLDNASELDEFLTRRNTIPSRCVAHRRSCFQKYGYWPEDVPFGGDWQLWIRIIEGGGRANFAPCRESTGFHFVAGWRREREASLAERRKLMGTKGWWPVVMQLEIPEGVSEQQVIFDAISTQGPDWVAALRKRAADAVDRVTWAGMVDLRVMSEKLVRLEAKATRLAQHLAEAEQRKVQLSQKLKTVHASPSWRITAPLRAISRLLKRWHRP
jgi:hypothetical protein